MRITFTSISIPKDIAKSIHRTLRFLEYKISLSQCQEVTAKLGGFRGWHELNASVIKGEYVGKPFDSSFMVAKKTHERLINLVEALGVTRPHAQYCASVMPMSEFHAIKTNKAQSISGHFIAVAKMLRGNGYRLVCQGDMHGTVQFRMNKEWVTDPRKRTRLADEIVALSADCGGYAAVWSGNSTVNAKIVELDVENFTS